MEVRAEGLTKVFDELTAVDHLTFRLTQRQIWGFIGPNGAGKTTTLRMLATIEDPTEGDAWLDGCSVTRNADEVRRAIGFMPDYLGAYPNMLVREYLDFFARAYGLKGEGRRRRLEEIVGFIEIGPLLGKKVEDLSRGMRQRISLGRALVHDPEVLLLDEPAAGLDPQARRDLQELLRLLAAERKTIFISSHILAELEELVDQVVIIDRGKLVYAGPPEERHADGTRKTVLDLRVIGDLARAARLLLEQPGVRHVHSLEPDRIKVEMSGGKEQVARLVQRLVSNSVVPYQVMTEGKLLERIFLDATRNNRDAADAEAD
ncbi:MAG: ABC transporter ATP-binding protein [Planctomycetota bacterium]|jgi:ABC-2 type transport system ATP-binding protein